MRFRFGIQTGMLASKYTASAASQGTSRSFQTSSSDADNGKADDSSPSHRRNFISNDISENPNVCGDAIFNPLVEASDLHISSLASSIPAFLDPFGVEQWISSVATSSVSTTTYATSNTSSSSSSSSHILSTRPLLLTTSKG